ncbi:MAG: sporulation protein YqfD [Clostridiaceae bacterium]|nr:sporulation protein YqfD [Clostridiaceae bacterium]
MLVLAIWNYFRGYVIIKIEGLALEKFINMCIARGIYLWDIRRINYTTLEAKVGIQGFKILRKLTRRAGCKVYISKKNGYPFWFSKMKKRKMLLMGAFFSFILLMVISSFVFKVDIVGNEMVSDEEIITILEDSGLRPGSNRYFINIREIENNLLVQIHELAWVGIELKGINAKVEIVEKTPSPQRISKDIPCDVVARKEGVIERVIARNGDALVEKGDIVSEGDLLITGIIERPKMETPLYVHAYGEVYARTYYEHNKSMDLVKVHKEKTGEMFTRTIVKIGDMEIALSRGDHPYEVYILEKTSKKPIQWRNKGLPVEIITEEYYQAIEREEELDLEKTKGMLHEEMLEEILQQIPKDLEISNSKTSFLVKGNLLKGNVIIEVVEDIAQQKQLQVEKLQFEED